MSEAPVKDRIFLKSYRIRQNGKKGGAVVSIPISWLTDQGLKIGDKLDAYQTMSGEIALVPRADSSPSQKNQEAV